MEEEKCIKEESKESRELKKDKWEKRNRGEWRTIEAPAKQRGRKREDKCCRRSLSERGKTSNQNSNLFKCFITAF